MTNCADRDGGLSLFRQRVRAASRRAAGPWWLVPDRASAGWWARSDASGVFLPDANGAAIASARAADQDLAIGVGSG
jgi:hypothetical protein